MPHGGHGCRLLAALSAAVGLVCLAVGLHPTPCPPLGPPFPHALPWPGLPQAACPAVPVQRCLPPQAGARAPTRAVAWLTPPAAKARCCNGQALPAIPPHTHTHVPAVQPFALAMPRTPFQEVVGKERARLMLQQQMQRPCCSICAASAQHLRSTPHPPGNPPISTFLAVQRAGLPTRPLQPN